MFLPDSVQDQDIGQSKSHEVHDAVIADLKSPEFKKIRMDMKRNVLPVGGHFNRIPLSARPHRTVRHGQLWPRHRRP